MVDSLIDFDLQNAAVTENLSEFIAELVCEGALFMARALRTTFIHKYEEHRARMVPDLLDFSKANLAANSKKRYMPKKGFCTGHFLSLARKCNLTVVIRHASFEVPSANSRGFLCLFQTRRAPCSRSSRLSSRSRSL